MNLFTQQVYLPNGSTYQLSVITKNNLPNGSIYQLKINTRINLLNGSIYQTSIITKINLPNGSIYQTGWALFRNFVAQTDLFMEQNLTEISQNHEH